MVRRDVTAGETRSVAFIPPPPTRESLREIVVFLFDISQTVKPIGPVTGTEKKRRVVPELN